MLTTTTPKPLLEVSITLIVPSIILIQLSDPAYLGTVNALLLALPACREPLIEKLPRSTKDVSPVDEVEL
jgi:hypothetical protein